MTYLELQNLVRENQQSPTKSDFAVHHLAWQTISRAELASIILVGKMEGTASHQSSAMIDEGEFWSPSAKIISTQYPYAECDVYRMEDFNEYFLVYEEFGGHRPELRCRYFDPSLVV